MEGPRTRAPLQRFLRAWQWMCSSIPQFSSIISALSEFLEKVYKHVGKRTKRSVAGVLLSQLGWSGKEDEAVYKFKKAVERQVILPHRDITIRICVYTDASELLWSGVVTQVLLADLNKAHGDQTHQPLTFLSGHFSGSQLGWSILDKEAFAIMVTTECLHWLLAKPSGFDLYTDHNNLIFLFDPLAVAPDLSQISKKSPAMGGLSKRLQLYIHSYQG